MNPLEGPLLAVRETIGRACLRARRSVDDVKLIGVTKGVDVSRIKAAIDLGVTDFGENYFQEARSKIEAIGHGATWHMIGHIQSNKVKYIPKYFAWVHSVDRQEIAEGIDRFGIPVNVLFELNLSGESTKHGTTIDGLRRVLEKTASLPNVRPSGLMTMAPYSDDPERSRPFFRRLREILGIMNGEFSLQMKELSMGMSGDFEIAIEEGATMVRVGTAIFGER